jgi:Bacterial protein of unknown function (DUF882)
LHRHALIILMLLAGGFMPAPASAQGLFGLLRGSDTFEVGERAQLPGQPLSLLPINPVARTAEMPPASIKLLEYAEARRVTVPLPRLRAGSVKAPLAAEAELPEVVDADEVAAATKAAIENSEAQTRQSIPMPPRLAAFADPRTLTDAPSMRPTGLRVSEHPVAGMPGVFADEDAEFACLPAELKQVLVDTAARFGHVAVLNAKRSRGTGARASFHYHCRAVDFRVRGVAIRTVYGYLRDHPDVGGRKIYPMGFFHIDNGPSRSW